MNDAHIVISDWQSDWVCARMARYLSEGTGWSIGPHVEPGAEWNIFFPYLEYAGHETDCHTRKAGFMTHKETTRPSKARLWDDIGATLDLRISMARMYVDELAQHGPTVHIPCPVELDLFALKEDARHNPPRIGVAGRVYPGGRKGENLVARLAHEIGQRWTLTASGKGWPVSDCHDRPWADMPRFYQSLDVYLCTAIIEGGPRGVFEALACGTPVVVPSG